jgi:protease-4
VKAGENIDLGSPVTAMTEEGRQLLQNMADEFSARFRQIVQDSRPGLQPAALSELDGRVFTATRALKLGFIDEIGYLDDAVQMARELSGSLDARLVMFHRCNDRARSPYALTPNVPLQGGMLPLSVPGLDRSRLPTFLYMWEPDPGLEKWGGH